MKLSTVHRKEKGEGKENKVDEKTLRDLELYSWWRRKIANPLSKIDGNTIEKLTFWPSWGLKDREKLSLIDALILNHGKQ